MNHSNQEKVVHPIFFASCFKGDLKPICAINLSLPGSWPPKTMVSLFIIFITLHDFTFMSFVLDDVP